MKDFLNIFNKIFFAGLIGLLLFLGVRFARNTSQIYPLPYLSSAIDQGEIKKAEGADIILLGDSSTHDLDRSLDDFIQNTAQDLERPLKIFDWGTRGEPMGVTLKKVKALKKNPLLFIYTGGRDPLIYQKFPLKTLSTIQENIKLSKNAILLTMIMAYPELSRLIYSPHQKYNLSKERKTYDTQISSGDIMKLLQTLYEIYSMEAKEFFSFMKERDAQVWVIPQPLNIELPPLRVCENTMDLSMAKTLEKGETLLEKGRIKEAFTLLNESVKLNKGNALLYNAIAQTLMKMGSFSEAKKAFYQSMIYDCGLRRSNPIFLKILMEEAEKRQFQVIDFNRMVTKNLGHNILFLDEESPQPLYYQYLNDKLTKKFLKFMKDMQ